LREAEKFARKRHESELRAARAARLRAVDKPEHRIAIESRIQVLREQRDLSSTAGAGGELVNGPLHVASAFSTSARARGVMPDILNTVNLPGRGLKFQTPRFATAAAVAIQQELGAVQETDSSTNLVSANVSTIPGHVDVSRQLLDRSDPMMTDRALAAELGNAIAEELGRQLINGSGSSAQLRGLLNASGIQTATYTDATPTVGELLPKLADLYQRVSVTFPRMRSFFIPGGTHGCTRRRTALGRRSSHSFQPSVSRFRAFRPH